MSDSPLRQLLLELRETNQYPFALLVEVPGPLRRLDAESNAPTESGLIAVDFEEHLRLGFSESAYIPINLGDWSGLFVSLSIGRSRSCDVCLPDPSVSKRHATLQAHRLGGEYRLIDEGSRNGTFVSARRLPPREPVAIFSGTHVGFGDALYVFVDAATLRKMASLLGPR